LGQVVVHGDHVGSGRAQRARVYARSAAQVDDGLTRQRAVTALQVVGHLGGEQRVERLGVGLLVAPEAPERAHTAHAGGSGAQLPPARGASPTSRLSRCRLMLISAPASSSCVRTRVRASSVGSLWNCPRTSGSMIAATNRSARKRQRSSAIRYWTAR